MNVKENKDILKSNKKICDIHANRLKISVDFFENKLPFTENYLININNDEVAYLDMLTTRFSKLQDFIGENIFVLILKCLEENTERKSFIDILNLLEKLEILPSVQMWRDMREIRNHITHEYPDDMALMLTNLNSAVSYAKDLLEYWKILSIKIDKILN